MSGIVKDFPDIEFFLVLVILIIASVGYQTWRRRKDISTENKMFVK